MDHRLAGRFIAVRRDAVVADLAALDEALATLIGLARSRFALGLDDEALVDRLAAVADLDGEPAAAVVALSPEIVLAAGCLAGDRAAIAVLDHEYGASLRGLVASMVGDAAPDIVQDVWSRLLVPTADRPAKLGDYGGRGSLLSWLRVVAAREAITMLRRRRDVVLDEEVLAGRVVAALDPALALIRHQSAAAIKRAFEQAVAALSVRERNLLRQHLLDGLTIDDLGALYRVHRATAARWLADARDAVWRRTQSVLRSELALSRSELDSLLGEVREWLDLSLERVLR